MKTNKHISIGRKHNRFHRQVEAALAAHDEKLEREEYRNEARLWAVVDRNGCSEYEAEHILSAVRRFNAGKRTRLDLDHEWEMQTKLLSDVRGARNAAAAAIAHQKTDNKFLSAMRQALAGVRI